MSDDKSTGEATATRPSWGWLVGTTIVLVCLVVGGILLCVYGHPVWGVILIVIGVVIAAALIGVSCMMIKLFRSGPAAILGNVATGESYGANVEESFKSANSGLSDEDLARMNANRTKQSADTQAWFEANKDQVEDVSITAEDGCKQVGHVLLTHPESKRWFIYAHGFGGGWRNGLGYGRHFSQDRGFNLLFLDMRAQGESEGAVIGAGHLERRDIVVWCNWLVERYGEDISIVLFGSSMGAGAVLEASGEEDLPKQVALTVSDSGYADMWGSVVSMMSSMKIKGIKIPARPLLDVFRFMFKHSKGGYDIADASPVTAIAHSHVPVMIVQGATDVVVGPENGDQLDRAAGGAAAGDGHDLLVMPAAGHCCSAMANPELYYERVFAFVDRWCSEA